MKLVLYILAFILTSYYGITQTTTGNIEGIVQLSNNASSPVFIQLKNTQNNFVQERVLPKAGKYQFYNLQPGDSYQLIFASLDTDSLIMNDVQVILGKNVEINVTLHENAHHLKPILIVSSKKENQIEPNGNITINGNIIERYPLKGQGFNNLFAAVPQAYIRDPNAGAVSFSGQNNRFNSLYIDGALQNDVFGLSPSGTYGGQSNINAVSVETIDQFQVQLNPFDASLGGYIGAAINVTTKSGKNTPYASAYHYSQLHNQSQQQNGVIISGPIAYNRTFYYFNAEYQQTNWEHSFDFEKYNGNTANKNQFNSFVQSVKNNFGYDPGKLSAFLTNNHWKFSLRIDQIIKKRNRVSLIIRKSIGEKQMSNESTEQFLFLNNSGKQNSSSITSATLEVNSFLKNGINNQMVMNFSNVKDHANPLGSPFPSVSILDGEGFIFLGSNTDALNNYTYQNNWNFRNKMSLTKKKHLLNTGVDLEYNTLSNSYLQNIYGSYFYYTPIDFLRGLKPVDYQINYYVSSNKKINDVNEIACKQFKAAIYFNDQFELTKKIKLQTGLRITAEKIGGQPFADSLTSLEILPRIQQYYDISNVAYGNNLPIQISLSPRINIQFKFPQKAVIIDIGSGIFGGRMPTAWITGMYNNNGVNYESFTASDLIRKKIQFNPNANNQWKPNQLGTKGNRGVLNIVDKDITMPAVWRSSLWVNKAWANQWEIKGELMYYFNKNELSFYNVNILPATDRIVGPDNRAVVASDNQGKIPALADSSNPYDQIIWMKNNTTQHGYGYRYGIEIKKILHSTKLTLNYNYGKSYSLYDGNYSTLLNQWRLNENVHGRNNLDIAESDFSAGHHIQLVANKEWISSKKTKKIMLSIIYNGKSGDQFSYVYDKNNLTRDDINSTGYDLLYIPTSEELSKQIFIPMVTKNNYYSGEEQKQALEWVVAHNNYLTSRRGKYAERNGLRLPFIHEFDAKLAVTHYLKLNGRKYALNFSFAIFNIGNLINADWGNYYVAPSNKIKLIHFKGYLSANDLTPTYSFNPEVINHEKKIGYNGIIIDFRQEWRLQVGLKLSFY